MHTATSHKFFRLLVPATSTTPLNAQTVVLEGTPWTTTDATSMIIGEIPEYTCISYSWGSGRTENPIELGQLMSDRVIPVIETAIRTLRPAAIWVDAFCIPVQEPARTACLRSMGFVYGSASRVVAILDKRCSVLLDKVTRQGCFDEEDLRLLESDEWGNRAWTYQEIVNSKACSFAAEGGSASLDAMQFLNDLMCALEEYKKAHRYNSFTLRTLHPRLHHLEDTIADWLTADFAKRSAYQAMSAMDLRTAETPDGCFNAMIGTICAEPLSSGYATTLHPAECFMQMRGRGQFLDSNMARHLHDSHFGPMESSTSDPAPPTCQ